MLFYFVKFVIGVRRYRLVMDISNIFKLYFYFEFILMSISFVKIFVHKKNTKEALDKCIKLTSTS